MNKLDLIERNLIGLRNELTLISSEGFAMHDTCCDRHNVNCNQGRDCPASNVVAFQSRNELHRHFAPGVIDGPHERITATDIGVIVAAYLMGTMLMAGMLSVLWLVAQVAYAWVAENGLFAVLAVLGVAL